MLPRVTIDPAPQVPVWSLLVVLGLAAILAAAVVIGGVVHAVFAAALVVAVVVRPSGPAPALVAVGAGLLLLTGGPVGALVHLLVFLVHVVVHLAGIVDTLPWDARVERRVLTRSAGSFLGIQGFAQGLAVLGAWASGADVGGAAVPLMAAVALAGLALTAVAFVSDARGR